MPETIVEQGRPQARTSTAIEGVPEDTRRPLVRLIYWITRRQYKRVPGPAKALAHDMKVLLAYGCFEKACDRAHKLDHRLKHIAELRAAQQVGCEYCLDIGPWVARKDGVPERQIRELHLYQASDAFDHLDRLVLEYADSMTRTPVVVGDDLRAQLREHLDEAQLVELTTVIALENWRARFNHALAVPPDDFSRPEERLAAAA
jgi:AhpD family alkylhydroperoxidase